MGVILRTRRAGKLSSLSEVINQLREQAGFRIAPALLADILRESEEEQ